MTGGIPSREERRGEALRTRIDVAVSGRIPATPVVARIVDISLEGCSVELCEATRAALGATIILTPPGLRPLRGQVAWVSTFRLGMCFDRAITAQTIRDLQELSSEHRPFP